MVTGAGSETLAVEAMRAGAADYVVKNPGYLAELPSVVERAWRHHDLEQRADELQRLTLLVSSAIDRAKTFHEIVEGARRLLRADACALYVAGPTGVALEAFAGDRDQEGAELRDAAVRSLTTSDDGMLPGSAERLLMPIPKQDGTSLGVLIVVAAGVGGYLPEEVALARTFASYAGIAIANLEQLERERTVVSELQQTLELRRSLVASVSHELRTPLTCIVGFTATLLRRWMDLGDDARLEILERIERSSHDLSELVEQLLDFAAVEAGRVEVAPTTVGLDAQVGSVLADLAPLLGTRPVERDIPAVAVTVDASLLRRTLANLISNAAKYTEPGTPLIVRARSDGEAIRVEVVDQGPGMTPDEVAQVFNPFWRAKHSIAGRRGTGIGLSLVQDYVRLMGGQVTVESNPETGSTFAFTIPLAVPATVPPG
jgi:two-component system sensor histidine kinase KdpD